MPEQLATGPTVWTKVSDPRIKESSGVAASWRYPGSFFTHNDSGDAARVFRFDATGKVVDEVLVSNARAVDWEDMASARVGGRPFLFLGDIGDNAGVRESIVVYRVPEPPTGVKEATADLVLELKYPDEPHNAETLMVHPKTGDLYIVTKAATKPAQVYVLRRPVKSGRYTLSKTGDIQFAGTIREQRLVTGGAISPDGSHVVLRTYLQAHLFRAPSRFDDWLKAKPEPIQTGLELIGEGVTFTLDGKALITTGEGSPFTVYRLGLGSR